MLFGEATELLISPLKKSDYYRLVKNDEMQGAQIPRNEAHIQYVAVKRSEAQRRGSRFSPARIGNMRLSW
jgi:hypothetical protein